MGVAVIVGALDLRPRLATSRRRSCSPSSSTTPAGAAASTSSLLGLLMAQYTFTGYDASAHMTEETHDASTAGPEGHRPVHLDLLDRGLRPAARLHLRHPVVRRRPRAPRPGRRPRRSCSTRSARPAGKLLLLVVIGAQLFCGMASVTANSRMIYAFSRDGALPFSHVWHTVSPRTRTPVAAVWLAAVGALVLGLPVSDQCHGVRGRDLDRGDRPLHRVRHPDAAAAAQGRRVRTGALAPGPLVPGRSASWR